MLLTDAEQPGLMRVCHRCARVNQDDVQRAIDAAEQVLNRMQESVVACGCPSCTVMAKALRRNGCGM